MAKRRTAKINPHAPRDPYGEKPRNTLTSVLGPNMFSQQGQSNRGSVNFPWPQGARSDGADDDDEDRRQQLPRTRKGTGQGGYDGY